MGYLFEIDGTTVWEPALRVGELYLRAAEALGAVLDSDPGLTFASDEVDIDLDRFEAFTGRLLVDYTQTNHPVSRALIWPVLGVAIVLVDRGGRPIEPADPQQQAALEAARQAFGSIVGT